jgi:hypothetical protein
LALYPPPPHVPICYEIARHLLRDVFAQQNLLKGCFLLKNPVRIKRA